MRISSVNNYSFSAAQKTNTKSQQNDNPISKSGEKALLVKSTFVAGLGFGAKLLFEILDGEFVVDTLGNKADKIIENQKRNVSNRKKDLLKLGAWAGLVMMFIGGIAALYTLFKAPKINYEGNVNAFTKGKDIDVYIKGNEAEKEILTQMNEKAKSSNSEEKAKLKEQYMQMKMAKNKVPDFVKLDRK